MLREEIKNPYLGSVYTKNQRQRSNIALTAKMESLKNGLQPRTERLCFIPWISMRAMSQASLQY